MLSYKAVDCKHFCWMLTSSIALWLVQNCTFSYISDVIIIIIIIDLSKYSLCFAV